MSWLLPLLNNLNYWTVFLLMFIEGSVIPAPSELIVPPAAYRAAAGELNIVLVGCRNHRGSTRFFGQLRCGLLPRPPRYIPLCQQQAGTSLPVEPRED